MADKTPPPDERGTESGFRVDVAPSNAEPAVFEALADRRRRYVLFSLVDAPDGVAELDELSEQVHRWERAAEDALPDDHRDRVVASLYHVHLPALADAGLVEFDARSKTARYRGDGTHEAILELLTAIDRD